MAVVSPLQDVIDEESCHLMTDFIAEKYTIHAGRSKIERIVCSCLFLTLGVSKMKLAVELIQFIKLDPCCVNEKRNSTYTCPTEKDIFALTVLNIFHFRQTSISHR